jgi:imidazolonepropionase-like amidohydrolase
MTRTILLTVVSFAASPALAQDLTVKAPPQNQPLAIVGATIHPVGAPDVEDGVIYFDQGEIKGIHTRAEWEQIVRTASFGAPLRVIDAKGRHVYPGLISPYSQLGLTEIQALRQTNDTSETGDVTPETIAATAVNPDSTLLPVTRSNGILLAATFPTGGTVSGCASVIRMDGWTTREMTVSERAGLVARFPSMRVITAWWMDQPEEEQQRQSSAALDRLRTTFDTARAYDSARDADPDTPVDLRWEAMRALWNEGTDKLPLFVHANDLDQINAAVSFCLERNLRCVIVGGREADRCADLLKRNNIPVIISGGTFQLPRRSDAPYDEPYTLPRRLREAGVLFSIAGGDDTAHERNLPYVVAMAVAHGLSHDAGIRAITLDAATILGISDRYGSLEKGKSATLIVTSGSPLEVTTRVLHAFIDGREIDLSNKQTKLYEKYLERYRQTGDLK